MKYQNIREEELKNRVAQDYFWLFDCTKIIGNVDFCVCMHRTSKALPEQESLLWAEAKRGASDIYNSLVQLILTIGKARTFDKYLPPAMLGAFDGEKIAFIPYNDIHELFYQNDFNWNVAPSNYATKEFQLIHNKVKSSIDNKTFLFNYEKEESELKRFIKSNFADGKFGQTKIKIDKNNFINIYNKWLETVLPTIAVNWKKAKARGIIDGDFYLADLLSAENKTLKERLFVLLRHHYYEFDRVIDEDDMYNSKRAEFSDNQKIHTQFWTKYERPPHEDYWDYIVERRDLLVPQDVRERKGSFFTPKIWVEKSQEYIAEVLGEHWQDEYTVWDCCAGTGNLLAGLTNKYNIWASTLDKQDVDVMHDRIKNGANLLESHVFQFDFLNDDFSKLPQGLQDIINDEKKRKKLLIYINPPYAEAASRDTVIGLAENKTDVAVKTKIYAKYLSTIGIAGRELFAQFLIRIYCEIPSCALANFSKLKNLQAPNFLDFRAKFQPSLKKIFVVPANTFDNVKGKFPIGFFIWNTGKQETFTEITADIYNDEGILTGTKRFSSYDGLKSINDWIILTRNRNNEKKIGFISCKGNDFQNTNFIFIINDKNQLPHPRGSWVTDKNIIEISIYYAVRHCIEADWLNDRDQFLYPNDGWQNDFEFQNDCLAYTLFSNNIRATPVIADLTRNPLKKRDSDFRQTESITTNHWIPFTEYQVGAQDKFDSNFMTDFIAGKTNFPTVFEPDLFYYAAGDSGGGGGYRQPEYYEPKERIFSPAAKEVFAVGRELWKYYHSQKNINVNASLYDIREYFQGRDEKGKMKNISPDEHYNELIGNLRKELKILAKKIEPKVYEYEFLKR